MPTITYVHPDGSSESVQVEAETSVMRAAIQNGVRGIVGECGGQAMCATCHVYVLDAEELPEPSEDEEEMLECTAATRKANSRLGCQLKAHTHFQTLTVALPDRQV